MKPNTEAGQSIWHRCVILDHTGRVILASDSASTKYIKQLTLLVVLASYLLKMTPKNWTNTQVKFYF